MSARSRDTKEAFNASKSRAGWDMGEEYSSARGSRKEKDLVFQEDRNAFAFTVSYLLLQLCSYVIPVLIRCLSSVRRQIAVQKPWAYMVPTAFVERFASNA